MGVVAIDTTLLHHDRRSQADRGFPHIRFKSEKRPLGDLLQGAQGFGFKGISRPAFGKSPGKRIGAEHPHFAHVDLGGEALAEQDAQCGWNRDGFFLGVIVMSDFNTVHFDRIHNFRAVKLAKFIHGLCIGIGA